MLSALIPETTKCPSIRYYKKPRIVSWTKCLMLTRTMKVSLILDTWHAADIRVVNTFPCGIPLSSGYRLTKFFFQEEFVHIVTTMA